MIDIKNNKETDIKQVFGTKKYNKWLKDYSIFKNQDIKDWIIDMIDQYTDEGKEAVKFKPQSYLKILQQYCDYNKEDNPTELLKETIKLRNRRVKKYLNFLLNVKDNDPELKRIGFRPTKIDKSKEETEENLTIKKPANSTIRNNIQSRIKSFYKNRGYLISYKLKTVKSGDNKFELTLDKKIIRKIQSKLESINYRLICKFESQTGLRINDILEELTSGKYSIEQYKEDEKDLNYFIRNFETQKEKIIINFLFFTEELSDYIKSATGTNDLKKLDLTILFKTRRKTKINQTDYLDRLKKIVAELGIEENIKTHGLRKYFITQVASDKDLPNNWQKQFTGHSLDFRTETYDKNMENIKIYFENWKPIEQLVCIDCIVYDHTNVEIKNLKDKYEYVIKEATDKDKRINELNGEIKEIKFLIKVMAPVFQGLHESVKGTKDGKDITITSEDLEKFKDILKEEEKKQKSK